MNLSSRELISLIREELSNFLDEMKYDSRKDVEGYVDADELKGKRVWTHTNRTHRNQGKNGMIGIYGTTSSGARTGNPLYYTNCIRLGPPVVFQTSESGVERIQKTGKRTLVAGTSGKVLETNEGENLSGFLPFTFSPFGDKKFFHLESDPNKKLVSGDEVYFQASEDGKYTSLVKNPVFQNDSENKQLYLPYEPDEMKNITKLSPKEKRRYNRKPKQTPNKIQLPLEFED